MHLNSRLLFEKYAKSAFVSGIRVLEIGPDGFPSTYQQVVSDDNVSWDTLDMDDYSFANGQTTYRTVDGYSFPIESDTFDIVVSGQVLEHVSKIWLWMKEVSRVCKKGGRVITIVPLSAPFHEYPIDCWRVYPDGMRALYADAGLDTLLSVFESLEPKRSRVEMLARAVGSILVGRPRTPFVEPTDTIAIGIKK